MKYAMNLLQKAKFTLHSGQETDFKIDCDALTDSDIVTCAHLGAKLVPAFERVIGVPSGGLRLAEVLRSYATDGGGILIVDDVMTTGASMHEARGKARADFPDADIFGLVIFDRSKFLESPVWIQPIFDLNPMLR